MRKATLLFCTLLLFLAWRPQTVLAQEQGLIEGQVMNATAGAPSGSVAGLEVSLYGTVGESRDLLADITTDDQGRFRFADLDTDTERVYGVELEYQGVLYGTQSTFPPSDSVLHVVVTIHETTASAEAIVVDRHRIVANFDRDALLIHEVYIFHNTGDTIYVGDGRTTLRFSMPSAATSLTFDGQEADFTRTEEGFVSLRPLPPGQREVAYSYEVPYDGVGLALSRAILYPTFSIDVLVSQVGVQVESTQLKYQGLTAGDERPYLHYSARDLPAGDEMELRLSGTPQQTTVPFVTRPSLDLGLQEVAPLIALALGLLGALLPVAQLRVRRRSVASTESLGADTEARPAYAEEPGSERDELLQLIADVDDAFDEGHLDEQAHEHLRSRLKRRLRDVWMEKQQRVGEGSEA